MKSKFNLILALGALVFVAVACSGSFTTANISSFNFGKNDKADPPTTNFNVGDKVHIVTNVSNTSSKHKMRFKVFYENVEGHKKGDEALTKDFDFEGAKTVTLYFDVPVPGEFRAEAVLLAEDGKEIDKKSGNFSVKGSAASTDSKKAPADAEKPKDATDADKEADADK